MTPLEQGFPTTALKHFGMQPIAEDSPYGDDNPWPFPSNPCAPAWP